MDNRSLFRYEVTYLNDFNEEQTRYCFARSEEEAKEAFKTFCDSNNYNFSILKIEKVSMFFD